MAAYKIKELPPPDPSWNSEATCVNARGTVGGIIYPNFLFEGHLVEDLFHSRATLWPSPLTPQPIGAIADQMSQLLDINDNGDVVGFSSPDGQTSTFSAFLFQGESLIPLDPAIAALDSKGFNGSQAKGINNKGQVVGYVGNTGFFYDSKTGIASAVIGSASGKIASEADAINQSGAVAGMNQNAIPEAFVAEGGNFAALGRYFYPQAINDSGIVISTNRFATCDSTTVPPAFAPIPVPAGLFGGLAWGINGFGDVVGNCTNVSGAMVAFLSTGLVSWDLNTLIPANSGWQLQIARDINDHGQIVGKGLLNGQIRGFLMTPPPGVRPGIQARIPEVDILDTLITIFGFAPIDGTGSSIVIRGGRPVRVGPVGPQAGETSAKVDILISLAIDEMASRLSGGRGRTTIRRAALDNLRSLIEALQRRLERDENQ